MQNGIQPLDKTIEEMCAFFLLLLLHHRVVPHLTVHTCLNSNDETVVLIGAKVRVHYSLFFKLLLKLEKEGELGVSRYLLMLQL